MKKDRIGLNSVLLFAMATAPLYKSPSVKINSKPIIKLKKQNNEMDCMAHGNKHRSYSN